ncbi:hypothetical protein QTP86_013177 [Hemibagrus guttatus]|nr:hypothetical protein QTP86_013177 [Hemibagrus guttatus]
MSFLRRVAGRSLRDRVRSSVTREELGVEPLLLHIERGQLRWLGHLFRMPPGRLPGEVFRACPTGKRPRGRSRTRWRDYVSRRPSGRAGGSVWGEGDLEKAYDRVPREELWYCMRKSGVAEKYVRVVQDMYERSRTVVKCAVGQTEEFNMKVGLHQGSALSPFLFAIVMDQLSEEVRQESPWTMMFADDIVICSESREQVEENLERWRFALERRGMRKGQS